MYYKTLASEGKKSKDDRLAIFIAGDDVHAKQVVEKLIEDIGLQRWTMTVNEAHKELTRV